ncbi:MAG: nucleotidyltransferase family protein [Marinilabiliaceae bacterium]
MNAMIFAAGLGSRLRPLTDKKPKALIEVNGRPLLEIALRKMEHAGINKVVVNIHHHRDQILNFLENFQTSGMEILISDEKDKLLDTGGGLIKARPLFDPEDSVLLYSVDIVTTADISAFIRFHETENPLASLMVKNRPTSRYLLFDDQMQLAGWKNTHSGETIMTRPVMNPVQKGFQGIHIVSPAFFEQIEETGPFPITQPYLRLAATHKIKGFEPTNDIWFDIGTPEKLRNTEQFIRQHPEISKNIAR